MRLRGQLLEVLSITIFLSFLYMGIYGSERCDVVQEEQPKKELPTLTDQEIAMIEFVVAHECSICGSIEQEDIVHVILNRVEDKRYPNTVYEVITEKNAFSGLNKYDLNKSIEISEVVQRAINADERSNAIGFFNEEKATNTKWVDFAKQHVVFSGEYHDFYSY